MENIKLNLLTEEIVRKFHEDVQNIQSINQWKKEIFHLIDQITELKFPSSSSKEEEESSLDPNDWISARSIAHQMLDSSLDYIEYVRTRPVCQSIPPDIRMKIEEECLPEQGQSFLSACDQTINNIIPYGRGNMHPRYWGWVSGEGTLGGVIADMIAATLNTNACTAASISSYVEGTVIEWMRQIFHFPKDTYGGLLVSGTSIATIISMAAARTKALTNVRENGIRNESQLIVYASTEAHICIKKSLELIGLGSKSLHLIRIFK
jgi:hypothetical protein